MAGREKGGLKWRHRKKDFPVRKKDFPVQHFL
jgi:hypothetical protein